VLSAEKEQHAKVCSPRVIAAAPEGLAWTWLSPIGDEARRPPRHAVPFDTMAGVTVEPKGDYRTTLTDGEGDFAHPALGLAAAVGLQNWRHVTLSCSRRSNRGLGLEDGPVALAVKQARDGREDSDQPNKG